MKKTLFMLITLFAASMASAQIDSINKARIDRQKAAINNATIERNDYSAPVDGAKIINQPNDNSVRPSVTTPDTRTQRNADGTVKLPVTPDNTNTTPTGNSSNSK